jgi:hypothetical protein
MTEYIMIEKGKPYQWYYDRIIAHKYPYTYAVLEAAEQVIVYGDGIITPAQRAEIDRVAAEVYGHE